MGSCWRVFEQIYRGPKSCLYGQLKYYMELGEEGVDEYFFFFYNN